MASYQRGPFKHKTQTKHAYGNVSKENIWMHASIAQYVFNTSMHDAMQGFESQLIQIISEGPVGTRLKYIEATGGGIVLFPPPSFCSAG